MSEYSPENEMVKSQEGGMTQEKKEDDLPELSISPSEWMFKMGGKKYKLVELWGPQRDRYMNTQQNNLRFDGKGNVVGLKTFDDHMVDLIKLGLYVEGDNGEFQSLVGEAFCRSLPASTQKKLYEKLQKMSGLELKADEDAGNS